MVKRHIFHCLPKAYCVFHLQLPTSSLTHPPISTTVLFDSPKHGSPIICINTSLRPPITILPTFIPIIIMLYTTYFSQSHPNTISNEWTAKANASTFHHIPQSIPFTKSISYHFPATPTSSPPHYLSILLPLIPNSWTFFTIPKFPPIFETICLSIKAISLVLLGLNAFKVCYWTCMPFLLPSNF